MIGYAHESVRGTIQPMKSAGLAAVIAAMAIGLAAPVHADDPDADFAAQLHTYGIYGQKDYNAWLGKIACERLNKGLDANAYKSAEFVSRNLQRGTTTQQTWQFLGAAINTYCPEQTPVLQQAAEQHS
jgi:Protein of unknown function (DUF732)